MTTHQSESREGFFRPFYTSRRGAILSLASAQGSIHDGLAAALIARYFQLPDYEGIVLEPSRRYVALHENLILVGSSMLFVDPEAHDTRRRAEPVEAKALEDRLRRIAKACCFEFVGKGPRSLRNCVTDVTYVEETNRTEGRLVDYGVLRRVFRGHENTVIAEGFHKLGTLGAAKAATSTLTLDRIWEAASQLADRDDTRPLEILVRTTFHDQLGDGVFSIDGIGVELLCAVYDKRWIYDFRGDQRWTDQLPWTLERVAHSDGPSRNLPSDDQTPLPRIDVEADLTVLDTKVRKLAQNLLTKNLEKDVPVVPPPPNAQQKRLLRALVHAVDRFDINRAVEAAWHRRFVELPEGDSPIRKIRKQLFIYLAVSRMLGVAFHYDEDAIRLYFPRFEGGGTEGREFVGRFVQYVGSRMREGFGPILGHASTAYAHVDNQDQTYCLRLGRAALTLKLRLWSEEPLPSAGERR